MLDSHTSTRYTNFLQPTIQTYKLCLYIVYIHVFTLAKFSNGQSEEQAVRIVLCVLSEDSS